MAESTQEPSNKLVSIIIGIVIALVGGVVTPMFRGIDHNLKAIGEIRTIHVTDVKELGEKLEGHTKDGHPRSVLDAIDFSEEKAKFWQDRIEELEAEVERLKEKNSELRERVIKLEAGLK